MDTKKILSELVAERDRIDSAIAALEALGVASPASKPGRKPGKRGKRKGGITAAGRKRLSENMKKRWAERKKAKAKTL